MLDRLEQLAREATPGKWSAEDCGVANCWCLMVRTDHAMPKDEGQIVIPGGSAWKNDARYIAAANPATMLKLIAVVKAARQSLSALDSAALYDVSECSDASEALRLALVELER